MTSEELERCLLDGNYIPIMDWINRRRGYFSKTLYVDSADMEKIINKLVSYEEALTKIANIKGGDGYAHIQATIASNALKSGGCS